ncbi:autotransporter outer membrane beta-barrel domain-containing protein [Bartonella taylorii]|uniref:Autotransporter outer membrane beta-barrel domain-containing protein n=2 Tax=Bartonella taylorii TaxID=33046 RepID=A0A9Q9DMV0_BARTA|nr:autotransporter outer membrane beta-barrel domain-containing protein [Bartonella taylorii]USP03579.1 autotransporter outer membrane beta-barrel domain-containing protein [Bartonella taylorii]
MYKKTLLSYTAITATILLSAHSNAHTRSFFANKGADKIAPTGENYENVYALDGGKIHGKDLTISGLPVQERSTIKAISGVEANQSGSIIELEGNTTIKNVATGLWAHESGRIKMTGGSIRPKKVNIRIPIGVEAETNGSIELKNVAIEVSNQDQNTKTPDRTEIIEGVGTSIKSGGTLSMFASSIKANHLGVAFEESHNDKNALENVKIDIIGPLIAFKESIGISAIKKSKVSLKNITITHARTGIHANDNSQITISGGSIQGNNMGIYAEKESTITLENNIEILSNDYGLSANGLQSQITMKGGTLTTAGAQSAVLANSGGKIYLTDVVVHTNDDGTLTQKPQEEDEILMTQGLQAQYAQSKIIMIRGSMTTTGLQPAVLAGSGGQIDLIDVSIETNDIGLQAQNEQSKITMKGGTLTTTGWRSVIFATCGGQIELVDAHIHTDSNGLTVRGNQSKIILKDSEIRANILLVGRPNQGDSGESSVIANHSILEGSAKDSERNPTQTVLSLINGTTWYLKASTNNNNSQPFDLTKKLHSTVFMLNLNDSTIVFKEPTQDQYQTLHIGTKTPNTINNTVTNKTVYSATGSAKIYFNTQWSDSAPTEQQKTDRLLIHGNVSGTTTIYINNLSKNESKKAKNSVPWNRRGLSLVQVSGKAEETTFKLANGYTTIDGLPYKYVLNAYGPTSSNGKADVSQSLLGKNENFWDFRLQNIHLDPEEKTRALVPQVASYLVMPNAVFSAGYADVNNQNTLLNNTQIRVFYPETRKKKGIFLSSYGNKIILSSNHNPLQYGYGADVHYAALQAGITLAALENQNLTTEFGLLGTYGTLAFTPKDMEGSDKSTLNKWSLTAYGSVHHNNGMYVNAFFSYGALKGNITTALIGNTAKVDNTETLSASAIVGQKIITGIEKLIFEPQAQLVYQRLILGSFSDIDGFKANMGNPQQWLVRIGGRLTQTMLPIEGDHTVSFYGKFNILKAFGDKGTIQVGNTFHLDSMGASLKGGLGVNAHLSQNIVLHGDVSYQRNIQKSGISGTNFSGGIRYRF